MVVVAILALCASIVGFSLSSVSVSQAKKCAREMDAMISRGKMSAMSREGKVYIEFSVVGGKIMGAYYEGTYDEDLGEMVYTLVSKETLSSRKISVTYRTNTSPGVKIDLEARPLCLSFYKDTGALYQLNDTPGTLGGYDPNSYCQALVVSGGGTALEILLTPSTGSHELGVAG